MSLVDPDNRRPVDFNARAAALASIEGPDWEDLIQNWSNGHLKLAWTRRLLKLRTEFAEMFADGDYVPLRVTGAHREHIIAKSLAPFSQGGRVWPPAEAFDAALDVSGYSVEGFAEADATELRLSGLFRLFPAVVLKARFVGAVKPARKRVRS